MKLTKRNRRLLQRSALRLQERGFAVELVIAILVIFIGTIVIYKLARLLKTIDKNNDGSTNNATAYYQTNYGGFSYSNPHIVRTSSQSGQSSGWSFSFNYTVCPAGAVRVLANNTNEYKVMLNLTTNLLVMDFMFDSLGNETEVDTTNAPVNVVVLKSTNCWSWNPIYTNFNIDPSQMYQFTDTNCTSAAAFYRNEVQ